MPISDFSPVEYFELQFSIAVHEIVFLGGIQNGDAIINLFDNTGRLGAVIHFYNDTWPLPTDRYINEVIYMHTQIILLTLVVMKLENNNQKIISYNSQTALATLKFISTN